MATIRSRTNADGKTMYTAQIRIKRGGKQVYQEAASFSRLKAAEAWAKRREVELEDPAALQRAQRGGSVSLADMIERYIAERDPARPMGKTKAATLRAVAASPLGELVEPELTSQALVDYVLWRMSDAGGNVQPQTAGNDLSHISAVLSIAKPAWGYDVDGRICEDARKVIKKLGYATRSRERDRRPTLEELDRLLTRFLEVQAFRPTSTAMAKVVGFALFSARRQEEITRIRWEDLDEARQRVLVRDMKNPGDKWGNDVWCHLPDEAWAILHSMPRVCAEIFPYNSDSISASWTRACKILGIENLHFHDLRHEGISRLFEMDWDIPRVASVSGHRDWNSLRRYTHLHGRSDPYREWSWLARIIAAPVELGTRGRGNATIPSH
ncbi:site-specific integrase [Pseudomonas sp. NW5]|uniref:site-specific integrase n=1 Tax=Pseudomonas sp. NW5 TaxID=2934934 RepID=UPI002020B79D|nr:site-specific integrase [Pseudomonas sp. NW5]MCL7463397.1 site-specific integrase [Pseudomonas sp. NW5]